ncbi:hypothetical protein FBU31_005350, partial [Coemansia sp. 'formosensis']
MSQPLDMPPPPPPLVRPPPDPPDSSATQQSPPYEVPIEYRVADEAEEAALIQCYPDAEYVCGNPPALPLNSTYSYEQENMHVHQMLLHTLVRDQWMLKELCFYVDSLALLGFEASRLMLLHVQLHFESKPDVPLPKIDVPFI